MNNNCNFNKYNPNPNYPQSNPNKETQPHYLNSNHKKKYIPNG